LFQPGVPVAAWRERLANGEVVPIPTKPVFFTMKCVVVADAVEEPIAKSVSMESIDEPCTERRANGEVVPTARFLPVER
jgi:hypothetical protein